ncbi:MAG: YpsA SLOG family protein [Verrucomicrobiales bacterium]
MKPIRIISGGQTGADRAALDWAIANGVPHGGWCPKGRLAEDGPIPDRYQLTETPTANYLQRNEWNVRDKRRHGDFLDGTDPHRRLEANG